MSLRNISRQLILCSLVILTFPAGLHADTIPVDRWLVVSGPGPRLPAFADTENIKGEPFTTTDLFGFNPLDISNHYPSENKVFPGGAGLNQNWSPAATNDSGFIELEKGLTAANHTAYLATYISVARWMKADLEVYSRQKLEVFLNGKPLGSKTTSQEEEAEPGKWKQEVELTGGKHKLLIRTFHSDTEKSPWQIGAGLIIPDWAGDSDVKIEFDPLQGKNINHLLDGIKAGPASISPDATLYAANFSRTLPPSDRSENWLEIKRVSDGKLIHSFRHGSINNFAWGPQGNIFSYKTERDGKSSLWIHDMSNGSYFALLEDIEDFGSYSWSPEGNFIIYSVSEKNDDKEGDLQRVLGMRDRLPGYRSRHFLYRVDIHTGWKQRLTHGFLTTSLHDISADGKKILFSQSRPDYLERPYSKQDVFIMDLESMAVDTIFKDMRWGVSGQFSPDGNRLLLTGGPSAFGEIGENIPEGMIANNYDTQAYIYDLAGRDIDPITREFDPSVSQAIWNENDNSIYLVAGEGDLTQLFRYNSRNRRYTRVDTGEDVLSHVSMAENAPFALFYGSGISSPPKVSLLDLKTGRFRELENPDLENFKNVIFGETRKWDFNNTEGVLIPGRVYLPPDFDESKKYPLIVYYYGGTNPVSRSFGGRYPFNMYAANGYVIYVLQPSGATGFGQEFSAHHVNNWGRTVADEIIRGTKLFLEDHHFIDNRRIGCMGASYGGFMTMLLQTRTDIFAAAISHAGISSISSYWGEGYWGYGYSAEASAGSFPWNNRELYVEQSPLFSADKITTPLLLLHGSDDTNVPPGESIQLYTALKLLDRPVELVKIAGEDHHILTYSKRIGWSNTILSWFDKWLKDQPQWWENMYPDRNY